MQTKGLIDYTQNDLEREARDLLRKRPEVPKCAPIKIEFLAENTANVHLDIIDGLKQKHNVEGCVCKAFMSKELTIFIDEEIYAGPKAQYHAAIAEEFSHIHLHMALFHQVETVEDFLELQANPAWPQFERDARLFSAAIRMPADLLIAEVELIYPQVTFEHGFSDVEKIEKTIRNTVAQRFVVPYEEIQYRMATWPCNLSRRITSSVQGSKSKLASDSDFSDIQPPIVQKQIIGHQRNDFGQN